MILVHICCSIDSHFFLSHLKKLYVNEEIIGFFYDPNIHPKAEYELRFEDVKRSCEKLKIPLFKGEYEYDEWYFKTKRFKNEPERGKRCEICFDLRLSKSIKEALRQGASKLTTTLLASPKKSKDQLLASLTKECNKAGISFLAPNFSKLEGLQTMQKMAKEAKLYHQNYCGCIYALKDQRKGATPELMSDLKGRVLPNSIEAKQRLYKQVSILEKEQKEFELIRQGFLNYRLLHARFYFDSVLTPAYVLSYSHFKKNCIKARIKTKQKSYFIARNELCFLEFEFFNKFLKNKRKNLKELLSSPLSIEEEKSIRKKLLCDYSLSPIVVVQDLVPAKLEIYAKSMIFEDVLEKIWLPL